MKIIVVIVVIFVAVVALALWWNQRPNSTTTAADASGQATFTMQSPFKIEFTLKCNDDKPPTFSAFVEHPGNVPAVSVSPQPPSPKACKCPNGDASTQNSWRVSATETYWEDMDAKKTLKQGAPVDLGVLDCPCSCRCGQLDGKCETGQAWCRNEGTCIPKGSWDCGHCGCGQCR